MLNSELINSDKNVMIDIEALGKSPNGLITSIGAAQFIPATGEILETFKVNINIQSALNVGLKVDGKTLLWWFEQDQEAIKAMIKDPLPIRDACANLRKWLDNLNPYVWANGGNYDFSMISDMYSALDQNCPWKHQKLMDIRTLKRFFKYTAPDQYFEIFHNHDAVDDCRRQIMMVKDIIDSTEL